MPPSSPTAIVVAIGGFVGTGLLFANCHRGHHRRRIGRKARFRLLVGAVAGLSKVSSPRWRRRRAYRHDRATGSCTNERALRPLCQVGTSTTGSILPIRRRRGLAWLQGAPPRRTLVAVSALVLLASAQRYARRKCCADRCQPYGALREWVQTDDAVRRAPYCRGTCSRKGSRRTCNGGEGDPLRGPCGGGSPGSCRQSVCTSCARRRRTAYS